MARNTALCVTLALAALCVVASAARAPRINNVLAPEYQKPVQGNAVLCELCDYASNFVEQYLEKNGTEQKVTDFVVNDVCPKLPESIAASCASYAPMLLSYAFQTIESELQKGKLCAPLCGDSTHEFAMAELQSNSTCNFCEKAATKVHDFLSQPGEIDKIINFVKEVCEIVPSGEHDKCVSTIEGFGPMALNYLVGLTSDPASACKMIDLC